MTEAFKPKPSMVIFVGCQIRVGVKTYRVRKDILPDELMCPPPAVGMVGLDVLVNEKLREAIAEVSKKAGSGK